LSDAAPKLSLAPVATPPEDSDSPHRGLSDSRGTLEDLWQRAAVGGFSDGLTLAALGCRAFLEREVGRRQKRTVPGELVRFSSGHSEVDAKVRRRPCRNEML
jgi:hypothetical protein